MADDAPKRYVRTFARDLEALEQGAAPDFATIPGKKEELPSLDSIKKLAESTADRRPNANLPRGEKGGVIPEVVAAAATEREEMLKPNFKPDEELTIRRLPPLAKPSERIVAGSPFIATPPPASPKLPPTPPATEAGATLVEEHLRPAPLHTYKSDFARELKDTSGSSASILAAEGDRERSTLLPGTEKMGRTRRLLFVAGGILLIGAGLTGAYLGYQRFIASSPLPVDTGPTDIIFADERGEVSGSGAELEGALAESSRIALPEGSVRLLLLAGATTSPNVFLALKLPAPSVLLRSVEPTMGVAGIVNASGEEAPFFILRVKSYSTSFAGMLRWEPAMARDLLPLFPPPQAPPAATSTASFTPAPPPSPAFKDKTVANHDARALSDATGRTFIIYGYWDPTTLVIARDESAFAELLSRLSTSRGQ